jgi:site-specific DNA-adenine methylase
MKNHFFYPYFGNKTQEVEYIYNSLDLKNIDTIVEPFCGSCAVSYYIWSQNKYKDYKYTLNDLDDNLINLLKSMRNGEYKKILFIFTVSNTFSLFIFHLTRCTSSLILFTSSYKTSSYKMK